MFCIAEFESQFGAKKEIAVVHSSWFQSEKKCFWPPFWKTKAKLVNAIKTGAQPDPLTWKLYDAERAKNRFFNSYENAHRNLMAYEEKSELSSEECSGRLRKRRRDDGDLDEDSSSSESAPPLVRPRKGNGGNQNARLGCTQSATHGLGTPPLPPEFVINNASSVQPRLVSVASIMNENEAFTSAATSTGVSHSNVFCPDSAEQINTIVNYDIVRNSQLFVSPQQTSSVRQETTSNNGRRGTSTIMYGMSPTTSKHPIFSLGGISGNDQQETEEYAETLKRIESNQEVLSLKLDNALNMLRTLVQAKHLSNSGRQLTNIRLPLTTVDEFKAMHEALRTNRELQEDLVTMLASKGGNNPNQIAHHITRSLMTDELMLSFTMKGQTGKEAFKDFIFLDCICDAVRRQPKGSVSTDFEIKKAVEYWLKRASKRINERNKRQADNQLRADSPI